MLRTKRLVGSSLSLLLACAGFVSAQTPVMLDEAEAAPAPLMGLLDQAGLKKPLDSAGINIYGYLEASYTFGFSSPPGNVITGRSPDIDHEEILFNQIALDIEKKIDLKKGKIDVGGKLEQIFGADARFTHSTGLEFYNHTYPNIALPVNASPENQYDITNAYVEVGLPTVGNGLIIGAGKFWTALGYEVVNPPGNKFYSHSFLYQNMPFTHTGVYAKYNVNDNVSATFSINRGWDTSLYDANGELSYLASVSYTHGKYSGTGTIMTGNESTVTNGWRTTLDYYGTYAFSDQLTLAFDSTFGWEAKRDPVDGGTAIFYGITGYASYLVNERFTLNGRLEWYDDQDGGAPYSIGGVSSVYYEATAGVAITPLPGDKILKNLVIRPELRIDYSTAPVFDGGTGHQQATFGIDAIFSY